MTILEEIQEFFGTTDFYQILGLKKDATNDAIKKAYRRTSLKIHPDRADEADKELATKKFQVLARVHFILTNSESRQLYDEHGIVANEDDLESQADWANYWRLLFPKISQSDIKNFMNTYRGSKDEEKDLIEIYTRFKGDMDKISETFISYDEEETRELIEKLIEEEKVKSYKSFAQEPKSKKIRRERRAKREAEQVESSDQNMDDLVAVIRNRQNNFNSMISSLEAKYATKKRKTK